VKVIKRGMVTRMLVGRGQMPPLVPLSG